MYTYPSFKSPYSFMPDAMAPSSTFAHEKNRRDDRHKTRSAKNLFLIFINSSIKHALNHDTASRG